MARALAEAERAAAIGWCGAAAEHAPVAALRRLVVQLRESEGGAYELTASGLDRTAQILLLTLCGRYEVRSIQKKGQRRNTLVLVGPETFLEKVLWPMFAKQMKAVVSGVDAWLHDALTAGLPDELGGGSA